MIALWLLACGSPESLPFEARLGGDVVACGEDISLDGQTFQVQDLRLFVHDLEQVSGSERRSLSLVSEAPWQRREVALLDFEDGCMNGTPELRTEVSVRGLDAPDRVAFTLGVPASLNHDNPLNAGAPLDLMAMHWGWRAGYKFLRLDMSSAEGGFSTHIGSVGCDVEDGALTGCVRENRVRLEAPVVDGTIVLDFDAWLAPVDLSVESDCMSNPTDTSCDALYDNFGALTER